MDTWQSSVRVVAVAGDALQARPGPLWRRSWTGVWLIGRYRDLETRAHAAERMSRSDSSSATNQPDRTTRRFDSEFF